MQTVERIWDENGANPVELETDTIEELITFDLAKRNFHGQAQFCDFVDHETWPQDLAFARDGTPRNY